MNNHIHLQVIQTIIKAVPALVPYLSENTLKAAGYEGVRTVMHGAVFGSVFGYLSGSGYAPAFREQMATAVSKAYLETADIAYQDAGAELPLDEDTAAWVRSELEQQFGFIDELFERLKELRKQDGVDAGAEAQARAEGYANALDGFANEVRLRASKNVTATWVLGATEKHCKTCSSLDGKSHRISWYIDRDYIPRKPDAAMDCHGYNCDCSLVDKNGNEYTI